MSARHASGLESLLARIQAAAARPHDDAIMLPPEAYTDAALFDLERELIFKKQWISVARVDELPQPGDYLTIQIDRTPVLVVRNKDGALNAFANVCSHRAMEVASGRGNARGFTCPYHGWNYSLDGKLAGAPRMGEKFCNDDHALSPLRLEIWLGFIFVNLDAGAAPLAPALAGFASQIRDFQIERMRVLRRDSLFWNCNWKIALENAVEPYHFNATHPESLAPYVPVANVNMTRPEHAFHAYEHRYSEIAPEPATPAYIPNTSGSNRIRELSIAGAIYPCMSYGVAYDWMWWISCTPVGIDRVRVDHWVCGPFDLKGEAADPKDPNYWFLATDDAFMPEDVDRVERVQRAVASGFAKQGPLNPLEEGVHGFIKNYSATLSAAN